MPKEELEKKDYYADRPTEPYSEDDSPNDWANIAHYAEENLEKAFKLIEELEKENTELRRNEFNARSCIELQQSQDKAILNYMGEQLTKAKEIINELLMNSYDENTREKALNFLYPDKKEEYK